jgi:membrane protein implicated in regulation of membrane protease activity
MVNLSKNVIYIIGLAIFIGAMLILSTMLWDLLAPLVAAFGAFAIVAVMLLAFVGAWIMKRGSNP